MRKLYIPEEAMAFSWWGRWYIHGFLLKGRSPFVYPVLVTGDGKDPHEAREDLLDKMADILTGA